MLLCAVIPLISAMESASSRSIAFLFLFWKCSRISTLPRLPFFAGLIDGVRPGGGDSGDGGTGEEPPSLSQSSSPRTLPMSAMNPGREPRRPAWAPGRAFSVDPERRDLPPAPSCTEPRRGRSVEPVRRPEVPSWREPRRGRSVEPERRCPGLGMYSAPWVRRVRRSCSASSLRACR